jgi:hypothetical protein
MAGGVRLRSAAPIRRGVLAAALTMGALVLPAWGLDDPTRPPAGLRGATPARLPGDGDLVLQSVIIAPSNRSAIISGEHVMLGGKIGAARLVKVSEGAVVLLIGNSQRRLELYPGVHKHGPAQAGQEQ